VVGLPALGATLVPLWRKRRWRHPDYCGSTLAPVHLVKLAVFAGVWQLSHAAVVTMWLVGFPALALRWCRCGNWRRGGGDHRVVITGPLHLV